MSQPRRASLSNLTINLVLPLSRSFQILLATIAFLITPVSVGFSTGLTHQGSKARLGINLSGPADWNTELPFVDVFRLSRSWISQMKDAGWGKGPELDLDEKGWVKSLEPDCWAETVMLTIDGGRFPEGIYTVLYDGEGRLTFGGPVSVESESDGRVSLFVRSGETGSVFLRIVETNPQNYVRNIRVIMPGFEENYAEQVFHPLFLERWKGMAVLRFMDWGHTNNSPVKDWSDRALPDQATWTGKAGIPIEVMIDLSNRIKVEPWFCIPHLATDDFVRNFAKLVKEKLDPSLRVHLEYSNEVWNGMFEQARWAEAQAKELGLGPPERPWEGRAEFYVMRTLEIFKIWEEVFGGKERLVRHLAWQAAGGEYWSDGMVLARTKPGDVDALSIAPYISMNIPERSNNAGQLTAEQVAAMSVEEILDHVEQVSLPECINWMYIQKSVADKYGIMLTAYEGGQHLVGVAGGENNEVLTKKLHEANRHPRMGAIYKKYFDEWKNVGGDLFAVFASIAKWTKWGSWGLAEYYDEQPASVPKYMATLEWAKSAGQPVTTQLPLTASR